MKSQIKYKLGEFKTEKSPDIVTYKKSKYHVLRSIYQKEILYYTF